MSRAKNKNFLSIGMFTPYFFPFEGGLQRAVYYLSTQLSCMNNKVFVFTLNFLSNISSNKKRLLIGPLIANLGKSEKIKDIYVRRSSYYIGPFNALLCPDIFFQTVRYKPSIVHVQGFIHLIFILPIIFAAKIIRRPVILTTHGLQEIYLELFDRSKIRSKRIKLVLMILIVKNVDKFIALSKKDEKVLIYLGVKPKDIIIIPNGVNFLKYININENKKRISNTSLGKRIILSVSRIARNKRIQDIITAAADITTKFKDVIFIHVGPEDDPLYKKELLNLIEDFGIQNDFLFLGFLPDSDLFDLYKNASIFVLASEVETFGIVILEAMAVGVPIISTNVGAIPEIIINGIHGYLVKPHDPKDISNYCIKILKHKGISQMMSKNCKIKASEYNWEEIAEKTIMVYDSVLHTNNIG